MEDTETLKLENATLNFNSNKSGRNNFSFLETAHRKYTESEYWVPCILKLLSVQ
jgi:hypothetical protein